MKDYEKLSGGEDGNLNKDISPYNIDFYCIKTIFITMLKRAGISGHKPHGFRSSFSTLCYEHQKEHGFNSEVIETQLAHSVGNKVTRAYIRSDFFEERRELLQWWEKFLNS
jgi:integrase